jgi:hypothetical protein
LSDASSSSDELSFDVPSSFVEDVPSSPSVELSSSADCSPEQLIRTVSLEVPPCSLEPQDETQRKTQRTVKSSEE